MEFLVPGRQKGLASIAPDPLVLGGAAQACPLLHSPEGKILPVEAERAPQGLRSWLSQTALPYGFAGIHAPEMGRQG